MKVKKKAYVTHIRPLSILPKDDKMINIHKTLSNPILHRNAQNLQEKNLEKKQRMHYTYAKLNLRNSTMNSKGQPKLTNLNN